MKNNKKINKLKFEKTRISKLESSKVRGGDMLDAGDTYTCGDSPMTSCNGGCDFSVLTY